jgi:hydroxymethylbilane synthase
LEIEEIRGNVDTRLRKLREGLYDAGVLAAAGLTRLGLAGVITSKFSSEEMLPAAGQGIVAVETLRDADFSLARINHEASAIAARCERGVLQKFGTVLDCYSPIAVHTTLNGSITIRAFYERPDGSAVRVEKSGARAEDVISAVYEGLNS